MRSEEMCERIATDFMTKHVNACKCDSKEEVAKALQKMIAVSLHALHLVENGKAEIVQ